MSNPYTHEEIIAFVGARLKKFGTGAMNDPKLNSSFVEMISVLPPAFQVLFVESGHDIVVGDMDEINRAYRAIDKGQNHDSVAGVFMPGERQIDNFKLRSPSLIRRTAAESFSLRTARHEKGHDIDYLLGKFQQKGQGAAQYFSSLSKDWQAALTREVGEKWKQLGITEKSPEEILNMSRETMTTLVAAQRKPEPLYDDYYPLLKHLSAYKTRDQRTLESFAEMCTHYTTLYAKMGANEASIDLKLSKAYPHLWPHFRDNVLPCIDAAAENLLNSRKRQMLIYAAAEKHLCKVWQIPFDSRSSFKTAGVALMDGTFTEKMGDLARLETFFQNPIDNYAAAVQRRDDAYFDYDQESVGEIDYEGDREEAHAILTVEGMRALGDRFLQIEAEKRSFESFVTAYDAIAKQIAADYEVNDYFAIATPSKTVVSYFRSKYHEGGDGAIRKHIERLPTQEDVAGFYQAFTDMQHFVDRLSQNVIGTKDFRQGVAKDVIENLYDSIEGRYYNPIPTRTAALKEERILLREYGQAMATLARSIKNHAASAFPDMTGPEILEAYEKIIRKSGVDGVKAETEKLKVMPSEIRQYVQARLSFMEWSSAYQQHGKNVPVFHDGKNLRIANVGSEVSIETYEAIASEIMDIVLQDGRDELMRLKDELRDRTRSIQRWVQGLEDAPDLSRYSNEVFDPKEAKPRGPDMLAMMKTVIRRFGL